MILMMFHHLSRGQKSIPSLSRGMIEEEMLQSSKADGPEFTQVPMNR